MKKNGSPWSTYFIQDLQLVQCVVMAPIEYQAIQINTITFISFHCENIITISCNFNRQINPISQSITTINNQVEYIPNNQHNPQLTSIPATNLNIIQCTSSIIVRVFQMDPNDPYDQNIITLDVE